MANDASKTGLWWLLAAGLAACFAYPLGVFAPMPTGARALLLASFGPMLGLGSFGLHRVLSLDRVSVRGALGAAANAIAGALFTTMMLVQLAAAQRDEARFAQAVWLGLDVAWDVYIGVGTLLFAGAAYAHAGFGRTIGIAGIAIASALLALNLWTFPVPPANAGLFDVGPLVGGWYFVVTLAAARILRQRA